MKNKKRERGNTMRKQLITALLAMGLGIPAFAQNQPAPASAGAQNGIVNLIPEKFQSFDRVTKNGRSATIKVVPGKSYLITVAAKLARPSTNPETALRFAIQEKGKKGVRFFEWYKLNAENFTNLSLLYKAPEKVDTITIVLKPRFTSEEIGICKDFKAVEVSGDLDE